MCAFALTHDGSASEFRLFFHVQPRAAAHWFGDNASVATSTTLTLYQTAIPTATPLVLNGSVSRDGDGGTVGHNWSVPAEVAAIAASLEGATSSVATLTLDLQNAPIGSHVPATC